MTTDPAAVRAACERIDRALGALAECMKPNDNATGDWAAKPDGEGVFWNLLGPKYASRPARTIVAVVELDSFPSELPTRANRVAEALVTLINDARLLLAATAPAPASPDEDDEMTPEETDELQQSKQGAPFYFQLRRFVGQLKKAREAMGLTLEQAAAKSGVSTEHLCRLETGTALNPTWRTLGMYAVAVGKAVQLLVLDEQEPIVVVRQSGGRPAPVSPAAGEFDTERFLVEYGNARVEAECRAADSAPVYAQYRVRLNAHLAALEADNRRLREALKALLHNMQQHHCEGGCHIEKARAALAPDGPR